MEVAAELLAVQQWRYEQARKAGLSKIEARLWAESDRDVSELRKLIDAKADVDWIRRIVL